MMKTNLDRRHFLRGTGALIALPALESIGFRRSASAADKTPTTPPNRMIFPGIGYGVTSETWFRDVHDKGARYKLPEGLKPLARHKDDFTIVQGCKHHFSRQAHLDTFFKRADKDRSGDLSVDELAGYIDSILR